MLIDLHVYNEGDPGAMCARAKEVGLDGLVFAGGADFADVDALKAAASAAELSGFVGCAVQTNRGVLLCLFPDLGAVRDNPGWLPSDADKLPSAGEIIDAVDELGGVVIAAHPYYKQIPSPMGDHIFSLKGLHACEAASPLATGMQRDLAIEAAESLQLPCVGGSAARSPEQVGQAVTFFTEPVASEADLVRQIRERRCVAIMSMDELPADARPSAPSQRPRHPGRGGRRRGGGRRPPRR